MAHWLPSGEILYNDLRGGKFVTVVRNLASGGERVVPFPTSAVSPDGRTIVSLNYARLRLTRPDYGYPGDGQDARWRADGRQLAFNSAHEGSRQIYVRDVAAGGKTGN